MPEVWIVDLQNDQLLVYGSLSDGAYGRQTSAARAETMLVTALSAVAVDLSSVWAP